MHRAVALIGLFGMIGAGFSLAVIPTTKTVAAPHDQRTFLIPASEGYGVADCLSKKTSDCGKIVANAWCEAKGFGKATTFGIAAAEDFTGTTAQRTANGEIERPLVITCGD